MVILSRDTARRRVVTHGKISKSLLPHPPNRAKFFHFISILTSNLTDSGLFARANRPDGCGNYILIFIQS